ncbi:MAG TPA: ComEC/Rec2 family competence protein [Candidatus Paceibacterota bacterium]|nr:ComEC/Rec2 family competence protein [Candidatus Paceibacterota bacterium]
MNHFRWLLVGFLAISNMVVWLSVLHYRSGKLEVHFLDVGQGDAILVETPGGNQMLVDGGADKKVLTRLGQELPFYDRSIDLVVATHPDADHIGGLPEVFSRFKISGFLGPQAPSDSDVAVLLDRRIEEERSTEVVARRGMRIKLDEDVYFDVLFPDVEVASWETNEASIVGRLSYGETSFLLTGDNVKAIENYLVGLDSRLLDADVLKVGHHGSKTSTSLAFLRAVDPDYAVISAGRSNSYGHPHPSTLDVLKKEKIAVLGTYDKGTVTFVSDGRELIVRQ